MYITVCNFIKHNRLVGASHYMLLHTTDINPLPIHCNYSNPVNCTHTIVLNPSSGVHGIMAKGKNNTTLILTIVGSCIPVTCVLAMCYQFTQGGSNTTTIRIVLCVPYLYYRRNPNEYLLYFVMLP